MCGQPWHNSRVTTAPTLNAGVALVVRRHVDFKRVCTSCCLP
ncbi:Ms4527A family Cys-rich leader peptide [Mycobacterium sp. WMMD1722]